MSGATSRIAETHKLTREERVKFGLPPDEPLDASASADPFELVRTAEARYDAAEAQLEAAKDWAKGLEKMAADQKAIEDERVAIQRRLVELKDQEDGIRLTLQTRKPAVPVDVASLTATFNAAADDLTRAQAALDAHLAASAPPPPVQVQPAPAPAPAVPPALPASASSTGDASPAPANDTTPPASPDPVVTVEAVPAPPVGPSSLTPDAPADGASEKGPTS